MGMFAKKCYWIYKINIITAFLHEFFDKEIYII